MDNESLLTQFSMRRPRLINAETNNIAFDLLAELRARLREARLI